MAISGPNREFIDSLIDYYVSEAEAYRQIAEQYVPEIESVPDAAFGIIAGCVYSSFLEMCRNQDIQPGLDEMTEFNRMLKERAAVIKKSIIDPSSIATVEPEGAGTGDAGGAENGTGPGDQDGGRGTKGDDDAATEHPAAPPPQATV